MRGVGRRQSRAYTNMINALNSAKENRSSDALRRFDIDFSAWPVDFDVKAIAGWVPKQMPSETIYHMNIYISGMPRSPRPL